MYTGNWFNDSHSIPVTGLTITVLNITDNNSIRDLYGLIVIEISFYLSSTDIMFSVCLSVPGQRPHKAIRGRSPRAILWGYP